MKTLAAILIIFILVIAGFGYYGYINSPSILAGMISKRTMTPVSIRNINWRSKAFTIEDLVIGNPKKAQLPTALRAQTITVEAPYRHYLKDPIVIDKIHMNNMYVNIQIYNKSQTEGNWHTISANLAIDHDSFFSVKKTALIKKLILTNIQVDMILSDGKLYKLSPIARLEFDNINSDKGIPTQEISEIIIQKMMHAIFLEKGLKAILEAPADIIRGVVPFL